MQIGKIFSTNIVYYRPRIFGLVIAGTILFSTMLSGRALAQGDIMVTPHRLVFDGTKRSEVLNIANTGQDTARYVVSLIQYRMTEDGSFEQITEPDSGQRFADPFIRFFPRNVVLGPNEAQTVKVQLSKTSQLQDGEYRSHFYFRAVPDQAPLGEEDAVIDSTITIKLQAIFGITIPVIIRKGESTAVVDITESSLEMINGTPVLNLTFKRSGNMSTYGNITVEHQGLDGIRTQVGMVRGMAVYTPNEIRRFRLQLSTDKGVDYTQGKLYVVYSVQSDARDAKLAEAEVAL
jgi:P pilus assembly chaperone PapD